MRLIAGLLVLLLSNGAGRAAEVAPAFELPRLTGEGRLSLANLRGQVVLLDFWASWCAPCRAAMPAYQTLQAELSANGFSVLAINLDEHPDDGRAFLRRVPVHYPVLSDPAGAVAERYRLTGMPTALLIDRQGRIRRRWVGFEPTELPALREEIASLLREAQ